MDPREVLLVFGLVMILGALAGGFVLIRRDRARQGRQPMSQPPAAGSGGTPAGFSDFLNFRYMITPPLITVLWVLSVVVITIGALATLNTNALVAIVGWILGMLWIRVVFEVMIVLFRINDGIQTIARQR